MLSSGGSRFLADAIVDGLKNRVGVYLSLELVRTRLTVMRQVASAPTSSTAVNGTQPRSNAQGPSRPFSSRYHLTGFLAFSKHRLVLDGRRSFPSGHSNVGLGFILLLPLLKSNSHTESAHGGPHQSNSGRLALILSPPAVVLWITMTRVEDFVRLPPCFHHHHHS